MLILLCDKPTASPGKCRLCGVGSDSDREWWIDTGVMEEWYGAVYYCSICLTQMANMAGFLSREQAAELDRDNENVRKQLRDYEADFALLRTVGIDAASIVESIRTSQQTTQTIGEGEGGSGNREIDAGKPLDESGPNDIPSPKPKRKPVLDLG